MTRYLEESTGFIKNNSGKFVFFIGIGFLLLGILFLSQVSSSLYWVSAIGFFFGVILTCIGLLIEIEFYSSYNFIGKLGSVFVTASLGFFAGALVSITYREIVGHKLIAVVFRGQILGWEVKALTNNPYAWLFLPLLVTGIGLLVSGAILKIYSEYF